MAFIPGAIALAGAGASAAATTAAGAFIASTAASVVGAGISAYGMMQQGRAAKAEAEYNAKVQENNAVTAGYAAIQEQQAAQRDAENLREQRIRTMASQRTAVAHSGLAISGSAVDVLGDTSIASEREIQTVLYGGRVASYNAGQQGANYLRQASFSRAAGANAKRSAYLQAGSTLLTAAAQSSMSYANFRKT